MNLLKKIWNSLGPFKIKSIYFGLILIVTAIFETLGIGIIYQIIKIIIEPDFIKNNYYLSSLSNYFNISGDQFILLILFTILIIFIIKNTLIVLFTKWQQNFLFHLHHHIF